MIIILPAIMLYSFIQIFECNYFLVLLHEYPLALKYFVLFVFLKILFILLLIFLREACISVGKRERERHRGKAPTGYLTALKSSQAKVAKVRSQLLNPSYQF